MIYLVSTRKYPESKHYEQASLNAFHEWFSTVSEYQLDVETNVTDDVTLREMYVVQFGSTDCKVQWIFDFASFTPEMIEYTRACLDLRDRVKVIFNAAFEYVVLKHTLGIDIDNIWDCMLALKVVLNGKSVNKEVFNYKGACFEYCGAVIDKTLQKSFTGEMLTEAQIIYCAIDVYYQSYLKELVLSWPETEEMKYTLWLENNAVRSFGDCTYTGFGFRTDIWNENMEWAKPQIEKSRQKVFSYITGELKTECELLGALQGMDEVTINWNSTEQKGRALTELYPELINFKKPALQKFEKTLPDENIIKLLLEKDYDTANNFMLNNHREFLLRENLMVAEGSVTLNLNSPPQRLKVFKLVEPQLESTANEFLEKCTHPMIDDYLEYISMEKLVSTYGAKWFTFIDSDGKVRPRKINQIVETGRISVSPGLQTIPADDYDLLNRYRQAFIPDYGWKFCAGDYKSQELAIIAYTSNEQVWINGLLEDLDLHSLSAAKAFGDKWKAAGGDPEGKQKPKSPEGKELRSHAKTVSFGLAYGMGISTLAKRTNTMRYEAKEIMGAYFAAFPSIKGMLEKSARFAVKNGYSVTLAPWCRRRYYGEWNTYHINQEDIASIERWGKNSPIQGSGADQTKYALILIKRKIEEMGWGNMVKIVFQLHDAILTQFRENLIPEWPKIQAALMEEAACSNIPGGLIKADMAVTDHWTK
jgi:hypothetical protein